MFQQTSLGRPTVTFNERIPKHCSSSDRYRYAIESAALIDFTKIQHNPIEFKSHLLCVQLLLNKFHEFSLCTDGNTGLRARQSERVVTSVGLMNKKETWHVRSKGSTRLMEKNHLLRLHKHAPKKTRIHRIDTVAPFFLVKQNICGRKRCNSEINTRQETIDKKVLQIE